MSEYSAEIVEFHGCYCKHCRAAFHNSRKNSNMLGCFFMGLVLCFFLIICGPKQLFFEIF